MACIIAAILASAFAYSSSARQQASLPALDNKVNPNTAPVASLRRLPGIGPARAEAIIALREKALAADGNEAFTSTADLRKVRGIGPKTAGNISGSVTFEGGR
jgi:competence protein ComEA